jgi:osmotically-inducible protein OsmY
MEKFLWLTPLLLSASLVLPGCEDSKAPDSKVVSERTGEGKMSDGDLENAVRAKLQSDDQIRQANLSVDAEAEENKVRIKGTVTSQDVRTKAIELARSVKPGLTITDEIEVRPAG